MTTSFSIRRQIEPADTEDVRAGWIRISKDLRRGIKSGEYIKLQTRNKTIYCQVRGAPNRNGSVVINEWYRELLGYEKLPTQKVALKISKVGFWGMLKAFKYHPDNIIRITFGLGLSSVGLGLISVAFIGDIDFCGNLIVSCAKIVLIGFALFFFVIGIMLFSMSPLTSKD